MLIADQVQNPKSYIFARKKERKEGKEGETKGGKEKKKSIWYSPHTSNGSEVTANNLVPGLHWNVQREVGKMDNQILKNYQYRKSQTTNIVIDLNFFLIIQY